MEKGILYAPDFVINAGGLINVAAELCPQGYNPIVSRDRVDALYDQLILIFDSAEKTGLSTHQTAVNIGDERLQKKIGMRTEALCFRKLILKQGSLWAFQSLLIDRLSFALTSLYPQWEEEKAEVVQKYARNFWTLSV